MRGFVVFASLVLLAAALTVNGAHSSRTLVLLDDLNIKSTHSIFFESLAARGHQLTFSHVFENKNRLEQYGKYNYDNLVIFAPSAEDFGDGITAEQIIQFIDSGRNVLMAVNQTASEAVREVASECGIDFDEEDTRVTDHFSFDTELDEAGDHTMVLADNWIQNSLFIGEKKPSAPILFNGISHTASHSSRLVTRILRGRATTYSAKSLGKNSVSPRVEETPIMGTGRDTLMVTAVQSRNNARAVFAGSLAMFSDKFFTSAITTPEGKTFPTSGNQQFCIALSQWVFQERGVLRSSPLSWSKVSPPEEGKPSQTLEVSPASYRVKDFARVSVVIEEYDSTTGEWKGFENGSDMQVEYVMLDPYIRTQLTHEGNGVYATTLQVPDNYGIFKFVLEYLRPGYTGLQLSQVVPVRPFRHNEYERFLPAAYPYYASAFTVMAAFFLFGLVFLGQKAETNKQA